MSNYGTLFNAWSNTHLAGFQCLAEVRRNFLRERKHTMGFVI